MAYVGHESSRELPRDVLGCPAGSTLRPRDPTHETCYWVLAVHGGPLAKMSGRGATPHCEQIVNPCRKARRHVGHIVWDHCQMSAYGMGVRLKMVLLGRGIEDGYDEGVRRECTE
ncbi:UNVERIFIED_CONTAM: hypothetical protein Sradi_3993300 [Sesamum radiatum]|uniref:Uncharacterized protein n=1 Tax=Sesamum radiatum TaxID=300843 RepID=A0AAW2PKU3_SESRA